MWVNKHKSTVFFYFTEKNHDAISFKLKKINGIIKLCTSKQHIVLRKKRKKKKNRRIHQNAGVLRKRMSNLTSYSTVLFNILRLKNCFGSDQKLSIIL